MKRLLLIFFTVSLGLSLFACGRAEAPSKYNETDFEGYWKYDEADGLYYISGDGRWAAYASYGKDAVTTGSYVYSGDTFILKTDSGISYFDLDAAGSDMLIDDDGDTLSRFVPGMIPTGDAAADAHGITGRWEFEGGWLVLYGNGTWERRDSDNVITDSGAYSISGDGVTLQSNSGEEMPALYLDREDKLVDGDGNGLERAGE